MKITRVGLEHRASECFVILTAMATNHYELCYACRPLADPCLRHRVRHPISSHKKGINIRVLPEDGSVMEVGV